MHAARSARSFGSNARRAAGERLGRLESCYVRVGSWSIHARVSARPATAGVAPLVLVHGLLVSSRYMVPTAARLAPHCSVYAPDLPGWGRSTKPDRALDVPQLAEALERWMAASGLERGVLVANSFGCQIAAELAARHPRRVERLVLLGPTVDPRARSLLKTAARWLLNLPLEPPSLDVIALRDLLDMGIPRLAATMRVMFADRIEDKLPRVLAPTLVVRGGRDTTVSQRWAVEATGLLPRGRLVVIPGAPHTINYNAPWRVAQLIRAFLAERCEPEPL